MSEIDEGEIVAVYAAALRAVFESVGAAAETIADDDGELLTLTTRIPRELYEDADRLIDREMAVHRLVALQAPEAAGRVALGFVPILSVAPETSMPHVPGPPSGGGSR